ncbi:GntR family transcriptional regulator [Leifsonia xyli subsp. xyli]|uniref:Transcriptional regulator, GntR family n=2 Tax=Leifsonia xyli subsp. xyli TaxID=59736 RepID=Q6AE09_LEIXX|nr:FCD domain-containing protein [Leifsonia xyli]AAT89387.1 transcriptional regulator, GntR family [Leifsonia xyli subsp. xyli str. CTCB07]ODA89708.1 GntR family transcriptional regulator [Leifsonia xyli subsp. xyli]
MAIEVQRRSVVQEAGDVLMRRIQEGEWGLGHKIPSESMLAAQLNVGRSTVREAVRQLAGKGMLESRQGAGVFVISTEPPENWETLFQTSPLGAILEIRMAIETEAARLAALHRTPAELRAMRRALDSRQGSSSVEEQVDDDTCFHRSIVLAAHNRLLLEIFDDFTPRVRAAMIALARASPAMRPEDDRDVHASLVEAVSARDADSAAALSRAHLTALSRLPTLA